MKYFRIVLFLIQILFKISTILCWNYGNSQQFTPLDLSIKYLSDVDARSSIDLSLSNLPYCDGELSICRDRTLGYLLIAAKESKNNPKELKFKAKRIYDLHGGGDIAVQCANKCSTLVRTNNGYQRCVAYSYDYVTNRCMIYDRIKFDHDWKSLLLTHQRLPNQLEESDSTVFAISVPKIRKLNRQTWIETQEVPIWKHLLGKIESQFSDCQRCSKFGCTYFSYEYSDRKCFYFPNDRPNYESEDDDDDGDKFVKMRSDYVTFYRLPEQTGELRDDQETELIDNKSRNGNANFNDNKHNKNQQSNNENNQNQAENNVEEIETEVEPYSNTEEELNCYEDGFHVNPNDCSKFYRCHSGFRFDFECPSGALYNHLIKTCDHSSRVDCGAQMKARIQIYSPPVCQGLHNHFFSHPDCTKFYQCNLGVLFAFDCAPGTHFNAETGICDYPSSAGCIARQSSTVLQQQQQQQQQDNRFPQSKAPKEILSQLKKQNESKYENKSKLQPAKIRAPKPRPVQESWVEYENDDKKKLSPKKKITKIESFRNQFEQCTPKSKKPCTLSNYDWLHLPDMAFEEQKSDQQKSVKKTLNPMSDEGMEECHELCLEYKPEQGLSCVAYSFNNQTRKCEIFGELQLPEDWKESLKDSQSDSPPHGFKSSPGTTSRIQLSEPQIVLGQWLVSPKLPEKMGSKSSRNVVISDFKPVSDNVKIKHFIDCLNSCAKQTKCTEFIYNSIDKQCLTRTKTTVDKKKDKKTTYKSGWISGRLLSDILDKTKHKDDIKKRVTKNAFMMQNDGELLDLLEQYQLEKSKEPLFSFGNSEHKHLNPTQVLSVKTPEECEEKCAKTHSSKDDFDQARRRKREKNDDNEVKECKFITIQRQLLTPKHSITCSLYSDDLIQTEIALLSRDLEKQSTGISDTNKIIGSVFGTKPLERSKRQAQKRRLIPPREHFEIISYPKHDDAGEIKNVEEFFNNLNDDKFKQFGLVSIGSLVEIPDRDYCYRYCLKQWQNPEAPFNDEIQCHALSITFNHESSDYTCTFYDRPNRPKSTGVIFYQLTHLIDESRGKKNVEKAFKKIMPSRVELEQISHYQAIQDFPNVQDVDACLRGCLQTWKSKDDSFSRCRIIVMNTTDVERSDRIFLKSRYDCAFYDLQIDSKPQDEKVHNSVRIFHKQKNVNHFEEIPSSLNEQILDAVHQQTKAFYHYSKASSSNECLETCKNIQNLTNINKRCSLVVIKKTMHKSEITQRSNAEFQCAFYENALQINFHDGSEKLHKEDESTKSQAFKVVKDEKNDKMKTEPLDPESTAINYAQNSFDPIAIVWNMSDASLCSEHCLRMIKNNIGNCQTALWNNYECRIYSFNSSHTELEDFNKKSNIKGYTLKEQEGTISSLLLKFKNVNYTEKFRQIRHLGPFLNPLRGRKAYESKIVNNVDDCFGLCLQKWTNAAVSKQRRLCRFVTIRNVSKNELECALYSHNATQALQSIRAISPKTIVNFEFDKQFDSSTLASWNGSIYRRLNWTLPLPVALNNIKEIQLNHLGDCLADCDEQANDCLAMIAEYSQDETNQILKCFTVGDGEYTPSEMIKKDRNLKIFVKIANIDSEMRQNKHTKLDDRQLRTQNSFMSLIKFIANYERQQQLAQLFDSL